MVTVVCMAAVAVNWLAFSSVKGYMIRLLTYLLSFTTPLKAEVGLPKVGNPPVGGGGEPTFGKPSYPLAIVPIYFN